MVFLTCGRKKISFLLSVFHVFILFNILLLILPKTLGYIGCSSVSLLRTTVSVFLTMIIGLSPCQIFQMTKRILDNNIIVIQNLEEEMLSVKSIFNLISCALCVFWKMNYSQNVHN